MTTAMERVNGTREPDIDLEAAARAEAIRLDAQAKAEAELIRAQGEADAKRIKAEQDAEKQRLTNERTALRVEREKAEHDLKMAKLAKEREDTEREAAKAREAEESEQQEKATAQKAIAEADDKWRKYAIRFAVVCGIVSLPVQVAAFWNPEAWWLVAAPLMLEGGAWVVHRGAAAAVANRRPVWHYRTIVYLLAFIAAGVNLGHGITAFDPATAIATAFASLAGPAVWDLHEHGRIAKRDGKLTRRQRKEQARVAKETAAKKAAEERRSAEREAYREKAAREAAEKLAKERSEQYPEIWEHALRLAAALGEATVTEAVWKKAHNNVMGADPGEDADTIRTRNAAARRVIAARSEAPGNSPVKVTNAQRDSQMPRRGRGNPGGPPVRGVRRPGDTPKYVGAARRQAAITAKHHTPKEA